MTRGINPAPDEAPRESVMAIIETRLYKRNHDIPHANIIRVAGTPERVSRMLPIIGTLTTAIMPARAMIAIAKMPIVFCLVKLNIYFYTIFKFTQTKIRYL